MRKLFYFWWFGSFTLLFAQGISVNNNTFSSANDMANFLVGNSCLEITNAQWSSPQSVAYFNQNGSNFAFPEGILIRSGQAVFTQGQYTGNNLSSSVGNFTDPFLQNLSNQSSGQTTPIRDVAFLEFDFVPISNAFSFDFLFASNEYGEFQCISNDIFAFVLTNMATGVSVNLAVVPTTGQPVSVRTIRNAAFNPNCNSSNPNLFGAFNELNPANSSLNMKGNTIPLTASASLIPNQPYRLRLSIADYGDTEFDSVIFVQAGSFETNFSLGNDISICSGEEVTVSVPFDNTYNFQWFFNNTPITGANQSFLNIQNVGTYSIEITKGNCVLTDQITVNELNVNTPQNLFDCNNGTGEGTYHLTINNTSQLGIDGTVYEVFYFASVVDVNNWTPIPTSQLNNFTAAPQDVFIKIRHIASGAVCNATYHFSLAILPELSSPNQVEVSFCATSNDTPFDLTSTQTDIINNQPGSFSFTFYATETDAINNVFAINPNIVIPQGTNAVTYWARIFYTNNSSCFQIVPIIVQVFDLPLVDSLDLVIVCNSFTLPPLTNGNYFTGLNATGTALSPGEVIDQDGVYYVFNGPDANGCTNQSTFQVVLIEDFAPTIDNCGSYTVTLPFDIGGFYTAPGGPNGTGTEIPPGTVYENTTQNSTSITLYYYAEFDGVVCQDEAYEIFIHPIPLVDDLPDVTYCDSFTLPPLTNGNYYASSGGIDLIPEGTTISTTREIFIRNTNAFCSAETSFMVQIVNTSQFVPQTACGSFTLPAIPIGNYYSQPNGQGNVIDPTLPITQNTTVYYYTNTTLAPNCTNNLAYEITILPLPEVDEIPSNTYCGFYILPTLTNGTYYRLPGGPNTTNQEMLSPFRVIDLSGTDLAPGTYYVYNGPNSFGCIIDYPFTIQIAPNPILDEVIDRIECSPYTVSSTNGTIYTAPGGPNGTGTIVNSIETFNEQRTFYLYAINNDSGCETDNPFTVFYNGIDLPDYPNVDRCLEDLYVLPALTHVPNSPTTNYSIGYFWEPNGTNPIPSNFIFNSVGTYTIYVFARNEGRFGVICTDEKTFTVTISDAPILPDITPLQGNFCGSLTLPALPNNNDFNFGYYTSSGGNISNLISSNNYEFTQPGTYTVWLYGRSTLNNNCFKETSITFRIFPKLSFQIPNRVICVDPVTNVSLQPITLQVPINPNQYQITWTLNGNIVGTGNNLLVFQAGQYEIQAIKVPNENPPQCDYLPYIVTVEASSAPIAEVVVTKPFEDIANAAVNILQGLGDYVYSLDGADFQSSPIFENITSGFHQITVLDTKGNCGQQVLSFFVLKHPKYFTPNGDGKNDTWKIDGLFMTLPDATVQIYDRYGKFIKQLTPQNPSWDGTFNGVALPSTDYWFQIFYQDSDGNNKEFKSHFSLKR
jgi:gliding motility-associated-like protein